MKQATAVIPVRYQSRRFPGKPLALIQGKPLVQRVYERAQKAKHVNRIIIATDDKRIYQTAENFGAEVRMTSPSHHSGTDRVAEVAKEIKSPIIINIQGDEPLLKGEVIDSLVVALQDNTIPMATLAARMNDLSLLNEKNIVKVVSDANGFALYFSRSPLPFQASDYFLQHIGIYGYQKDFLLAFSKMQPSRLEKTEKLEQLRALENGYKIKIIETQLHSLSVSSPQDIIKVENLLKKKNDD
ncbi:MAG: 3-deoxy-manno-octulosonate cytidylyltransferase [Candidatus Aminicenantes bacterium]|nr:3-deoxy-manno-octulosonate cytidylyltransferase [Candidatus Aminicenantes bacterium]